MRPPRVAIGVMAKAPTPGYAKTRLIPLLGADGAAALQQQLILRTVALARSVSPTLLQLLSGVTQRIRCGRSAIAIMARSGRRSAATTSACGCAMRCCRCGSRPTSPS